MTELQFLIDLLLNHKLSPTTKKLVAERVSFVEEQMRPNKPTVPHRTMPNIPVQAPSTQAILDREAGLDVPSPTNMMVAAAPTLPPSALATNRIVGGQVNTGNGTKGPRKF